jgi:tripartite-type tricarboxylate transporter receptor subunit TctC
MRRWSARRPRPAAYGALLLGASTIAFATLPTFSSPASTRPTAKAATKLVKPDFAYFAGKTINIIWANSAGSVPQFVSAIPEVEAYLHATIDITYVPTGSGIVGIDEAMSAAPNGLTLGGSALSSIVSQLVFNENDPYSFSVQAIQYVAATRGEPNLIVSCPNSGTDFTSMKQVIHSTTLVKEMATAGGTNDLALAMMSGAYRFPFQILTAFTGGAGVVAGCEQGDAPIAQVSEASVESAAGNALDPGVVPLLETGEQSTGSSLAFLNNQVPTLVTFVKDNPPKTKLGKLAMQDLINLEAATNPFLYLAAPRNTPLQYVEALRDAFFSAMSQAGVKAIYVKNDTIPGPYPYNKIQAYVKQQLKNESTFRKFITPNP